MTRMRSRQPPSPQIGSAGFRGPTLHMSLRQTARALLSPWIQHHLVPPHPVRHPVTCTATKTAHKLSLCADAGQKNKSP